MKNVEKRTLVGWTENIGHGLAKKLGISALGAAFLFSPVASTAIADGSDEVTHLEYLQWIAQMVGDQLPATATASDYVVWAQAKGMSPNGGWRPGAKLTKQAFAQVLVQLFNLKESLYPGDYVRILARQGIYLPDEEEITRAGLVAAADDAVFQRNIRNIGTASTGPGKPDNQPNSKPPAAPRGDAGGPDNQPNSKPPRPPQEDKEDKVTICHKGRTISVSKRALQVHLAHGDTVGPCVVTETQNP
jgi:hypothetical protein